MLGVHQKNVGWKVVKLLLDLCCAGKDKSMLKKPKSWKKDTEVIHFFVSFEHASLDVFQWFRCVLVAGVALSPTKDGLQQR